MVRRRRMMWASMLLVVLAGGIAVTLVFFFSGCQTVPPVSGNLHPTAYRSQRLLALAAEEAALIPDIDTRLTRQLNLADLQIRRGWSDDSLVTLTAVRDTLRSKDASTLNDHARLSGWISVSELSRSIKQLALAAEACEGAVKDMLAIEDLARRCQYVMGISNELQYIKGRSAAAELLAKAGPWTRSIDHLERRRQATVSFASALFNLDDYLAGQQMLRQDDSPAWRSETLARLAAIPDGRMSRAAESREQKDVMYYGKQLGYRSVFQNQKNSQTVKD